MSIDFMFVKLRRRLDFVEKFFICSVKKIRYLQYLQSYYTQYMKLHALQKLQKYACLSQELSLQVQRTLRTQTESH